MSNERQETIADIVADIRAQNQGLPEDSYALSPLVCDLLSLADRIEAAHQREREAGSEAAQICGEIGEMIGREATSEKYSQVGNAAKMREALMALIGVIDKYDSGNPLWWNSGAKGVMPLKDARSALSAPPRNCDVGTAVEKAERFKKFCASHRCFEDDCADCCSSDCPCYTEISCGLRWSQMPYEEGCEK